MKSYIIFGYTQEHGTVDLVPISLYTYADSEQKALQLRMQIEARLWPRRSFIATGIVEEK